jgi:hypothetical protein
VGNILIDCRTEVNFEPLGISGRKAVISKRNQLAGRCIIER